MAKIHGLVSHGSGRSADEISKIFEHYSTLANLFKEAVHGILRYQDDSSKLFYQVVIEVMSRNYLETSGSYMIAYILKDVGLEFY